MFVQCWRRMCHHQEMAPSHYLRMPRQMSTSWTRLQWKHCWSFQRPTIRCLLERSYCWMYRLPRKLEIQRRRKCLFLRRKIPHWAVPKTLISSPKNSKKNEKKTFLSIKTLYILQLSRKHKTFIETVLVLYNVPINVFKTDFVRYGCLEYVSRTPCVLWDIEIF